ncbi:MAG: AraC family transcriptional regulator [Verrucomicrobiae bacterium]|nr:AraC family transcriptional regulator [Verrucomicrobiae bacterium]
MWPNDILLSFIDMVLTLHWRNIVAPGDAFHVARSWRTPENPTPLHNHDFAEVFWIDAGEGVQRTPTGIQPLRVGDLIFVHPTDTHALESARVMQLTNVAFPRDTYRWITSRYVTPWTNGPVRYLEADQCQRLTRAADELFDAPRERLYIERFLLNLLHLLASTAQPTLPAEAPDWFRHACAEIAKPQHFREGAPAFARLAGRSPEHVARVTRALLHETPSDYVNRVRMQHAARLLAMTDAKITDIALDCGLTNLSHFYRLFRRHFGQTPQAYRLQQRTPA